MKYCWAIFVAVAFARGQAAIPFSQSSPILSPMVSGSGSSVLFGTLFSTSGVPGSGYNVCTANADGSGFRQLTNLAPAQRVEDISMTSDGRWAAYTVNPGSGHEEVHLLNVAAAPSVGSDRTLYSDPQGCVLPVAVGFGYSLTCLQTPHLSDDGSAVLFAQANTPTFLVAKNDGSPAVNLPVYSGTLAASSKRVISSAGQVVFTSTTASGVYIGDDVYLMNLDGSNIRKITQFNSRADSPQEATISADGSMIAFTMLAGGGINTLYTIGSDGYNLSAVAAGYYVSSPSLSADGSLLSSIDTGQVVLLKLGPPQVRTVLTHFQYPIAGDATISDDGSRVAFAKVLSMIHPGIIGLSGLVSLNGPTGVYTVSTATGSPQSVYAPRYVYPPTLAVAGSLAISSGVNLTLDTFGSASSLPLPQTLAGVSLTVGGRAAPLFSVNPYQIAYQIPPDATIGNDALQPQFADGVTAAASTASVAALMPSVLALIGTEAAVFHGNTGIAVDATHPATVGEVLVMYASGLGPTNPTVPAGSAAPANPPATTVNQPTVTIGSAQASVQFSGLAPGFVGLYQVNFVLPLGLNAGPQPLALSIAGQSFGSGPFINVK